LIQLESDFTGQNIPAPLKDPNVAFQPYELMFAVLIHASF
jgi:hypothetical protein